MPTWLIVVLAIVMLLSLLDGTGVVPLLIGVVAIVVTGVLVLAILVGDTSLGALNLSQFILLGVGDVLGVFAFWGFSG